ncbi:MAG TPA: PAS domain S-box protein, partial [Methanomassiliicoccales archaeon]|nr:PAS domain S-box protein [Methanomassiliicoccales archaeon]
IEALNSGATFYLQKGADAKAQFHELVHKIRLAVDKSRTERSLKDKEDLLDNLMVQSRDGFIFVDDAGLVSEWSKAQTEFTGIPREEAIGRPIWELLKLTLPSNEIRDDPMLVPLTEFLDRVKGGEGDWSKTIIERTLVDGEGRRRRVQIMLFPLRTSKGLMVVNIVRDVSSLHEVEADRDVADERFRKLVKVISDGVLQVDERGIVILCNPAYLKMAAMQEDQVIGLPIWDLLAKFLPLERRNDASRESLRSKIELALATGEGHWVNHPMELRLPNSLGHYRNVLNTIHPIKTFRGWSMWSIYTDVTDQKAMLENLRDSEARYRGLVEMSTDGIALFDENGRLLEWNPAMVRITGYAPGEIRGMEFYDLARMMAADPVFYDSQKRSVQADLRRALTTGQAPFFAKPLDNELRRKDGAVIWVRQVIFPIRTEKGHRIGAFLRDVTQEKEKLRKIQAETEYNRGLIETTPDPIMLIDSGGSVADSNQAAASSLGYTKEELLGRHLSEFVVDLPSYEEADRTILQDGQVRNLELDMRTKDGRILTFLTNGSLIRTQEGMMVGIVIAFKDITEQLTYRLQLEDLNKKLSILATITRHDITNKLMVVQGNLDLLERMCLGNDKAPVRVAQMRNALEAIQEQFEMAKYYQEMGSKRPEWYDLGLMLRKLVEIWPHPDMQVHVDAGDT